MQLLLAKYAAVVTVALLTAVVNLAAMLADRFEHRPGNVAVRRGGRLLRDVAGDRGLVGAVCRLFLSRAVGRHQLCPQFQGGAGLLDSADAGGHHAGDVFDDPRHQAARPAGSDSALEHCAVGPRPARTGASVQPATAFWVVVSTALFAVAAIGVAARIFGTDAILYGSHGTWSDLFHRPARPSAVPTPTSALLCLAIMFPAYFLASNLLARSGVVSIEGRLILAALVTVLVFLQIPLAVAVLNRVELDSGFQLRPARPLVFAGAAVLGFSLWPFAHEALVLLNRWELVSFDAKMLEAARGLVEKIRGVSPLLVVGSLAIVPAMCEEFFFRGFLMSAFQRSMSGARAVILSSVLFGLFHLVAIEQLHFERFVPSTCLGLVLGWLCLKSGSTLPGMLLHACHNGLLLMAAYYQKELAAWGFGLDQTVDVETAGLPASWLIAATIGAVDRLCTDHLGNPAPWRGRANVRM